jgi:hypothetical protein
MAKKHVVSADAEVLLQAVASAGILQGVEGYDGLEGVVGKKAARAKLPEATTNRLIGRLRQIVRPRVIRQARTKERVFHSVEEVSRAYGLHDNESASKSVSEDYRSTPKEPATTALRGAEEPTAAHLDLRLGIEDESSLLGVNDRPLRQELQEYLERIRFGVDPGVSLLAKRHTLCGHSCFLVCTWYIETEKMVWNLMGQLQDSDLGTEGVSPARCEADKILYDISRPVKVSGKVRWKEWTLPTYEGDFPGQTFHNVTASWTVFALVFPQPQFYRLWLNEQRRGGGRSQRTEPSGGGSKRDISRRLYDLRTGKKIKS